MAEDKRQSLNKDLTSRYATDRAGGAYKAQSAGEAEFATVDFLPNTFADGFTKSGKNTNLPKKDSMYLKGLDTRKYR